MTEAPGAPVIYNQAGGEAIRRHGPGDCPEFVELGHLLPDLER
jgi:hypothetical protein